MGARSHTAKITGSGRFLPGEPIGSDLLARALPGVRVDLFQQYFGVDTRHYVLDPFTGERQSLLNEKGDDVPLNTTEMGAQAALVALSDAGLAPGDIDAVITNSTTPDGTLPPFALKVQRRLGIDEAQLVDLRGGCSAALQALNAAVMLVETGRARAVLIVSAECTSPHYFGALRQMTNPQFTDVVNGLLFADGASALVVESADRGKAGYEITHTSSKSCFPGKRAGFVLNESEAGLETKHDNRAIRTTLPQVVARGYRDLEDAGYPHDDFDVMIVPQVNQTMIDLVASQRTQDQRASHCYYGNETGNVPAAAMFMAFDFARGRGRIKPGDKIGILSIETTSWNYAVAALRADTGLSS